MHVSMCFAAGIDLRLLERTEVAHALASLIRSVQIPEMQRRVWRPRDLEDLPAGISYVQALRVPAWSMAHWNVARAGWVGKLGLDAIQERIDEKAKHLTTYRAVAEENWLLMGVDLTKPSQSMALERDFDPSRIVSPFRKTFLYRYPEEVTELGTRGPVS